MRGYWLPVFARSQNPLTPPSPRWGEGAEPRAPYHSSAIVGTKPAERGNVQAAGCGVCGATPSFFCRLVDDVVYWNTKRFSG
jgi:hypothetical protein